MYEYQHSISAYPDTTCWLRFDSFENYLPMNQEYFWNPKFDDYSVVGVNYFQIYSFLHWKTVDYLQKHDEYIYFGLITEEQWDIVCNYQNLKGEKSIFKESIKNSDYSWELNLELEGKKYWVEDTVVNNLTGNFEHKDAINNIYGYNKLKKGVVYGMGDNVSEWVDEYYEFDWNPIYSKYLSLYGQDIINNVNFDTDGVLIRGGNWYHQAENEIEGRKMKTFANPNKNFSTVGFRYVVYR